MTLIRFAVMSSGPYLVVYKMSCRPARYGQYSCSKFMKSTGRWSVKRTLWNLADMHETEEAARRDRDEKCARYNTQRTRDGLKPRGVK